MNQQHQEFRQPLRRLRLQFSTLSEPHHLHRLQKSLKTYPGVSRCVVSTKKNQALIDFDPFIANLPSLRQAIEDAGLKAEPIIQKKSLKSTDLYLRPYMIA